jgi:RND family efflux transporter MFP subunit
VKISRYFLLILVAALLAGIAWQVFVRLDSSKGDTKTKSDKNRPVPVSLATIVKDSIAHERDLNGTLESYTEFLASPKVGGVIKNLSLDMADVVTRGQVIAVLESAEYDQAVIQSEAEVEVAQANLQEARSLLKIAERELKRIDKLSDRGLSSASQRDIAQADQLAKQAHVQVTLAELSRARAQLETARIRRDYTSVTADWNGTDEQRLVAERFVDEGETINANTPLLKIVTLNPITAVLNITEKEYAGLTPGQPVLVSTDAYPEEKFTGIVERISPVFQEATRQARIEVKIDNPELKLKPGMFVKARIILKQLQNVTIIPSRAVTVRDGKKGLFLLSDDARTVSWMEVETGIEQGQLIQITRDDLHGQVVTLGQQLLKDGSSIIVPAQQADRKTESR